MRPAPPIPLLTLLALSSPLDAQLRFRKIAEPAGDTLQKALRASVLAQPGARPFHIRVEIDQSSGPAADYKAVIEESWVSPGQWVRTVTTSAVMQKTVADGTGVHILTRGDYFPAWLRNFTTAIFDPVPESTRGYVANAPIEHAEFANGMRSSPCQHAEFQLGSAPLVQFNYADVCFRASDGLLERTNAPSYAMEFKDYADFENLRVARTLNGSGPPGVGLTGKIVTLETLQAPDLFALPAGAGGSDPLAVVTLPTEAMLRLSGGVPALQGPRHSGHGMFTVWINLDRSGQVREVRPLNSDDSGIASTMAAQLVGLHWAPLVQNGVPAQAQGPLVIAYPPSRQRN